MPPGNPSRARAHWPSRRLPHGSWKGCRAYRRISIRCRGRLAVRVGHRKAARQSQAGSPPRAVPSAMRQRISLHRAKSTAHSGPSAGSPSDRPGSRRGSSVPPVAECGQVCLNGTLSSLSSRPSRMPKFRHIPGHGRTNSCISGSRKSRGGESGYPPIGCPGSA